MIGFRELIFIVVIFVFIVPIIVGIVFLIRAASKPSKPSRSVAQRLAELESLRNAQQITAAEYDKQRAAIVSSV